MATVHRWTLYGILAFNMVLAASVLNLTYFAKQGPRYTAEDGAREKAERIQADQVHPYRHSPELLARLRDRL
jgi:hypothetical protein